MCRRPLMNAPTKLRPAGEAFAGFSVQPAWDRVAVALNERGSAVLEKLLAPEECGRIAALYRNDGGFRNRVVMSRHGFGKGEYKYFSYPLPDTVARLRASFYPPL